MFKKVKKIIFPGTTLIASLYISTLFTVGMVIGYLGTVFFHKKFIDTGRIRILIFSFEKWEVHLHHWVLGGLIILATYATNLLFSLPIFCVGIVGGLIFHDLYSDKKWYKVVYRKR